MIYLDEVMEIVLRKIEHLHQAKHGREPRCSIRSSRCGKYAAAEREISTAIERAVKPL